ncbi:hypothetical protein VaNZ11_010757 [Volvox africanus]|uniref:Pherophorin domain-containing protein n=1 Tax=Volvox africanus TaxID=51714 RepID=A0ABQ5SBF8_9CHLO|nr:hypothetical protein VaNZ11_010757 [Volvox africanus]
MARNSCVFAILAVAIAALLAALPAQAGNSSSLPQTNGSLFPPNCNCLRNGSASPFRLELLQPSAIAIQGFFRYCFNLANVGGCSPTQRCCNSTQGVYKIELDINAACKGYLRRVTVNNTNHTAFEFNTNSAVVRVTSLNLTVDAVNNTQVCLFIKASNESCSKLESFCTIGETACRYAIFQTDRTCCPVGVAGLLPSPPFLPMYEHPPPPPPLLPPVIEFTAPPPPPPSSFPNCSCDRAVTSSQYTVKPIADVSPAGDRNLTQICFTINTKASCKNSTSSCCTFTLSKLELDANPDCATALSYMSVDGVIRPRFFQYNPYPAIKITNINKTFDQADGTKVCLFMKPECNSLDELGANKDGTISAAVFNHPSEKINCCPVFTVR